jgi:hypothetical protein
MPDREGRRVADVARVGARAGVSGGDGLGQRGVGATPAQPPLPTACSFLFQRSGSGSQISTLMSESLDGVSVAATRQNAGSDA